MEKETTTLNFDKLFIKLTNVASFSEARQITKKSLFEIFNNLNDDQINFSKELYRWCNDKLHSRLTEHRIAAISGFSFFLDIEDDIEAILQLGDTLEKLLPIDAVIVIDGISYLLKRVVKKSPKITHIVERCKSWVTVRSSKAAIISSLFIFYRMSSHDSSFFKKYASEIDTYVRQAIVIPDERVVEVAVTLSEIRFENDPSANTTASNLISHLTYLISNDNSSIDEDSAKGIFKLFSSLMRNNKNVCQARVNHIIGAYASFFTKHKVEDFLDELCDLCKLLKDEVHQYASHFYSILCNENNHRCIFSSIDLNKVTHDASSPKPAKIEHHFLNEIHEMNINTSHSFNSSTFNRNFSKNVLINSNSLNDENEINNALNSNTPDEKDHAKVKKIDVNITFNNILVCKKLCQIIKYLPDVFCPYLNDVCFSLIYICSDCFFCLINCIIQYKPEIIDKEFVLGAIKRFQLSLYQADAIVSFAKAFPATIFNLMHIIVKKLDYDNYKKENQAFNETVDNDKIFLYHRCCLYLLSKLSFLKQFPLENYWDFVNQCFKQELEEYRVASLPALTAIIPRFKSDRQHLELYAILFAIHNDNKNVKIAFLNSIDDNILSLFVLPTEFFMIQEFFADDDLEIKELALNLIDRIHNYSPLSTFNFFHSQLQHFPKLYLQLPSKRSQKHYIKFLPHIISSSGYISGSYSTSITEFILNILKDTSIITKSQTPSIKIKQIKLIHKEYSIKQYAMESLSEITKFICLDETYPKKLQTNNLVLISNIIDAVLNQVILSKNKKNQLIATKTLRSLFRHLPLLKKIKNNVILMHQKLMQFLKTSTNYQVNYEMLRLLGTIGSLDPYEFYFIYPDVSSNFTSKLTEQINSTSSKNEIAFHPKESNEIEIYPLYNQTKREISYLNFVMKYILKQLKFHLQTHDISVLTNALSYIFQSEHSKCLVFLNEVIDIFSAMINQGSFNENHFPNSLIYDSQNMNIKSRNSWKNTLLISPSELFYFFKTIVQVVDIDILPYAEKIYKMIEPFLVIQNSKIVELDAIQLLNSLIFALKTNFTSYGVSTFSNIASLLSNRENLHMSIEIQDTLLLTLTLIVIFADGSSLIYFDIISHIINERNGKQVDVPIKFLCQVLRNCSVIHLAIPSLRIAYKFIHTENLYDTSMEMIELISIRFPQITKKLPKESELYKIAMLSKNSNIIFRSISKSTSNNSIEGQPTILNSESEKNDDSIFLFLKRFDPKPDHHSIPVKPPVTSIPLSQVLSGSRLQNSVIENDWNSWLLTLSQDLVLCSQSPAIRASHPLLRASPEFQHSLFPYIIVSVWDTSSNDDRQQLSCYLRGIVEMTSTPSDVLSVILAAAEALDRANFSLFDDPFICGKIAERSNNWFTALRFFSKAYSNNQDNNTISHMLRINSILKRKEAALGLLDITESPDSNCKLLEELSMWSRARNVYSKKIEEEPNNETYLAGYLKCSMHLEDWDAIEKYVNNFSSYTHDMQPKVALIFAAAVRNTHADDANKYLQFVNCEDPTTCMWRAIIAIDNHNLSDASFWVHKGLLLTALDMSSFSSGSYEPAIPTIFSSMMLEELADVIDQINNKISTDEVLNIWNSKANYINRDATQLRNIYQIRALLNCSREQKFKIKLDFVDSLRRLKEWTLFHNSFHHCFGDSYKQNFNQEEKESIMLMEAKYRYDCGISKDFREFENIIYSTENPEKPKEKNNLHSNAICAYVSRCPISPSKIPLIKKVISEDHTKIRAWKHWTYFNLGCVGMANQDNKMIATYASNAIKGFAHLVQLTKPSLHFLCQLCALFFTYADKLPRAKFCSAINHLTSLSPSSIIQIIPQLIVQFEHPKAEVRKIVFDIVHEFAKQHFQALAMPLCLLKKTSSSTIVLDFIESMAKEQSTLIEQTQSFTDDMVKLAVTDIDILMDEIDKVINLYNDIDKTKPEIIKICQNIYRLIKAEHVGFVDQILNDKKLIDHLTYHSARTFTASKLSHHHNIMNIGNQVQYGTPPEIISLPDIILAKNLIIMKFDSITSFDIREMGLSICSKPPKLLAVPGYYSVDKETITINNVFHIMKIIPSAQRPRKLRITGSNGKNYKYLLKGREDLRLDQRVTQLFSLTNSILDDDKFGAERHLQIIQVPIIPLAPNAGLIAWAEGGETLYSMIKWNRRLKNVSSDSEYLYLKKYIGNNLTVDRDNTLKLTTIQKLELHRELCSISSDDDIREALWLRSPNSEMWLTQTTNFSRSNALMSIVGYIIGIGDRHPSNILVNKGSGNVVHIDFSDVFEKASLRLYVHETVPFRLTRMLVQALGPSGIKGIFEKTAQYVMSLIRRNKETLLAFLDIFIQDPVTDMIWYKNFVDQNSNNQSNSNITENQRGSLMRKAIDRVSDKLNGRDFDGYPSLSPNDQVSLLIKAATDEMNLAQMYYGWVPFW